MSLPAPPFRTSLPLPPLRVSLPLPPLRVSLPPRPESLLLPLLPMSVSLKFVPVRFSMLTSRSKPAPFVFWNPDRLRLTLTPPIAPMVKTGPAGPVGLRKPLL
ncbi:MAG: hypothetical protein CV081_03230 [Nitrospira sp. LK265]|nr:hypothetical protein [Nitrospira sp. LK265]